MCKHELPMPHMWNYLSKSHTYCM